MTRSEIRDQYAEVITEANKILADVDRGVIIAVLAAETGEDPESLLGVVQDCVKQKSVQ